MNKNQRLQHSFVIILTCMLPLIAKAEVFFNDDFGNGSSINSLTPTPPTTNSTSYEMVSSKTWTPTPSVSSGDLKFGIGPTTAGHVEIQALFATNPVALIQVSNHIEMTVVFTNTSGILSLSEAVGFGLYSSGGNYPVAGGLNGTGVSGSTDHAEDGVKNWRGYWGQVAQSGYQNGHRILTRPAQIPGTLNNRNQDLVTTGSGSQSYGSPSATVVGSAVASTVNTTVGNPYTVVFSITLTAPSTLAITNTLYNGPDTSGAILAQFGGVASGGTFLTSGFDSFAVGWRQTQNSATSTMDICSIVISGQVTVISQPPTITLQPVPVLVATGGSAAFFTAADNFGFIPSYQWRRSGTNLVDGGNISGSSSATLILSPAGPADAVSGANGYYVTITGAGGYSTNSTTNSLTFITSTNLVWTGDNGAVWDVNNTVSWRDDNSNPSVFNYGFPVTFDDSANLRSVSVSGPYISPASVTINNSLTYNFSGPGQIAGPATVTVKGDGIVNINEPNSYTGGTILSNALAFVRLQNLSGLGSGPLTFAMAGAKLEVLTAGSATLGIQGDVQVLDDGLIQFDGVGAFAGVIFGNLSGTAGKTLTFNPADLSTTNRYRIYGNNTTMDANILLNGPAVSLANYYGTVLAAYGTGTQTYNGIISGNGGLVQRGGTTILNGQNTYGGGTWPTTATIGFGADTVGNVTSGPIGTGPLYLVPELPNATGSGTVLASGGARTIANPLQYPSATNNQTLIVGGTNSLTFSGPYTLNGNDVTGTNRNRILQVNNTALTTVSGVISDGGAGYGLTKTGTGILALSNTETYTGHTTVSAGTLRVNGQIGSGPVTVATNATFGGTGTILGPVTVQNGGNLAPGNSIGTLNLNSSLTLVGNLKIEVDTSAGTTSDKAVVTGTLTNAGTGTVIVTNLGTALVQGDTFTLFNKAMSNGAALNITGGQVAWDNKLAIDGTIAVLGPLVNINPTNIISSTSGGVLTLSWPADHIGWRLQVQTNSLSVGITTNWFDLAGTSTTNSVNITISTNGTVFYRLIYP